VSKVVVVGASGLVGLAAVERFSRLPAWEVVGVSRRVPDDVEGATFVSLDLDDVEACRKFAVSHSDITHIVYAALFEKPGLVPGWQERDQMQRNLAMLRNFFEPLSRVATRLRHISLLQGTKAYGAHLAPIAVPAKERWPRHRHDNFYWLQEDYLKSKQEGAYWTLTILRPQVIFGKALGANMNPIPALGAYAALLKERGESLYFPGGPFGWVFEGVDADLLADALTWAATSPSAANESFNVTNGDVMVWANVWPTIAEVFGMGPGPARPTSLAEAMPDYQDEWAALVRNHGLRSPASLREFVGQSFYYLDLLMGRGATETPPPVLVSTIKIRQAGFQECIDTEDMLVKWLRYFQHERLLPS
jgi:nucleoside-diphosphate-sugar epimerase